MSTSNYIMISIIAGSAGAIGMYLVMRLINRTGWAQGDMIFAVGSMVTKRRETAFAVGTAIHWVAAVAFAFCYLLALSKLDFVRFPQAVICGLFFGALHGIVVSLALVWVVSDQHPLEEFRSASFPIGVMHFAGHVVYGVIVGLVICASPPP